MKKADAAARRLYEQIEAPAGSFNTLACEDDQGPYIRVLVDRDIQTSMRIPSHFENFRVSVESRSKAFLVAAYSEE
jgi:hypothetical protein